VSPIDVEAPATTANGLRSGALVAKESKRMNPKLVNELTQSLKQAGAIARGDRRPSRKFIYSPSRIQAVREKTTLSQAQFAKLLGVSVKTLQNWEQARRQPTGPAAALLRIVEREPAVALRALGTRAA
jgi:putative transcriptional regulator